MEFREYITQTLRRITAEVREVDYRQRGYHLEALVDAADLRPFAQYLLEQGFYLVFLSGLHVRPAIEMTYQFAHHEFPCRLVGRVSVRPDNTLPTIADIFHGADWHEREARDLFGVVFVGHPNLQPLLLPEDTPDLKPLLKKDAALKDAAQVRRPQEKAEADPAPPTIRRQPGSAAS